MPSITPSPIANAGAYRAAITSPGANQASHDVFLHKAPAWVRYAPGPALVPHTPQRHHNVHIDRLVLETLRMPARPEHFHPALYRRTLIQLRERIAAHGRDTQTKPHIHQWTKRLETQLGERLNLLAQCRAQATQLIAC